MTLWNTIGEFFYGLSLEYVTIPRLLCLSALMIGYFFGMFQSGYIFSRAKHIDIYSKGSGNPGTTNMFRVLGPGWGLLTFIFDIAKVVGAIFLTKYIFLTWLHMPIDPIALKLYTGLGAVLGHNFPVYLRGRGGKGVAATCAVYVCLGEWKYIIIGLGVFLLMFLITRYVSLSSMVVIIVSMFEFLFFTLMNWTYVEHAWLIDCQVIVILFSVLVLITHRKNIMRLLYAEEPRFTFRKIPEEELSDEYGVEYYYEEDFVEEPEENASVMASAEDFDEVKAIETVADEVLAAEIVVTAAEEADLSSAADYIANDLAVHETTAEETEDTEQESAEEETEKEKITDDPEETAEVSEEPSDGASEEAENIITEEAIAEETVEAAAEPVEVEEPKQETAKEETAEAVETAEEPEEAAEEVSETETEETEKIADEETAEEEITAELEETAEAEEAAALQAAGIAAGIASVEASTVKTAEKTPIEEKALVFFDKIKKSVTDKNASLQRSVKNKVSHDKGIFAKLNKMGDTGKEKVSEVISAVVTTAEATTHKAKEAVKEKLPVPDTKETKDAVILSDMKETKDAAILSDTKDTDTDTDILKEAKKQEDTAPKDYRTNHNKSAPVKKKKKHSTTKKKKSNSTKKKKR